MVDRRPRPVVVVARRARRAHRRGLVAALAAACLVTLAASRPALAQSPEPLANHVRSSTRWGLDLIEEGRTKSPSFRALVDQLQQSDLVVYVEAAQQMGGVMLGSTEFGGCNGEFRYVRITIRVGAPRKKLLGMLGHELQHAVEIGTAPDVVDQASLDALYRRIGDESVDGYDSEAARDMGDKVYRELWEWKPVPAAAPPALVPPAGADPVNQELTHR